MSEGPNDFIPFNQSTPLHAGNQRPRFNSNHNRSFNNMSGNSGGFTSRWRNNSRNQSRQPYRNRFHQNHHNNDSNTTDSYLDPEMLQDPWANLTPVYIALENRSFVNTSFQ